MIKMKMPKKFNDIVINPDPQKRISKPVIDLLNETYCIDVHTHFFDMKCINASYLLIRLGKDLLGVRGKSEGQLNLVNEEAYKKIHEYKEGWEDKLLDNLAEIDNRGISPKVLPILLKRNMSDVYDYYIKKASLAEYFNLNKSKVLTTALMMDFKKGWGVGVGKSISYQIDEMIDLADKKPTLPFLFCDPRRADEPVESNENLYNLFIKAFHNDAGFFGVKLYPCLGYHPNDYRLWPIYELCEKNKIPVLSHCGGDAVTSDEIPLKIYDGNEEKELGGKNRQEISKKLNDPKHWEVVLDQFPNLKLNIAHFGSSPTWSHLGPAPDDVDPQKRKETILYLMEKFNNVYSDFSYTITDEKAVENFKIYLTNSKKMQKRTLFGSDFWVVYQEGDLKKKQKEFLDSFEDKQMVSNLCLRNSHAYLFE